MKHGECFGLPLRILGPHQTLYLKAVQYSYKSTVPRKSLPSVLLASYSMSAPLTIAILGATGTLGPSLLQAIADHPKVLDARIRILTRPTSAEKAHTLAARYPTLYLTVHAVDYTGAEAETGLAAALRGVDVVLSAVGDDSGLTRKDVAHSGLLPGFIAQDAVARAAKAAGVKLFVPSCVSVYYCTVIG
jgi:nucleoside-diphosphate-sugar epimerase